MSRKIAVSTYDFLRDRFETRKTPFGGDIERLRARAADSGFSPKLVAFFEQVRQKR